MMIFPYGAFRKRMKWLISPLNHTAVYRAVKSTGLANEIKKKILHEPECELLATIVKEGETVVDIGANVGVYTYWLAKAVGPGGKVFSFEPIPETFEILERVTSKLKVRNAELNNLGVSDTNGILKFDIPIQSNGQSASALVSLSGRVDDTDDYDNTGGYRNSMKFVTLEAPVVRLDDYLNDDDRLSFVKMDVEGAEPFCLRGAKELISKCHPTLLLEINPTFLKGFGMAPAEVCGPLKAQDYRMYWWDPQVRKLREVDESEIFPANYFFVHPKFRDRFADFL